MSRIIFLGTAGDSAVVTKQFRASGGIILQLEGLQFHLDPGPGVLQNAKEVGINLHYTSAIIVSNNSVNHCNDLNIAIDAMTHGGIETRGLVLGSKAVLQTTDNSTPFLTKHHQTLVEKVVPMEKNHKIGIELVEINALPVNHHNSHNLAFKFFCPKFTLGYTGDTSYNQELTESLTGSDILILNVPYPGETGKNNNLDTASAIKIISQVRPKIAIITHFGLEMLKADPIQEAREIQRITGVQTVAAKDGLLITPESYGKYKGPVKGF